MNDYFQTIMIKLIHHVTSFKSRGQISMLVVCG